MIYSWITPGSTWIPNGLALDSIRTKLSYEQLLTSLHNFGSELRVIDGPPTGSIDSSVGLHPHKLSRVLH